MSTIYQAPHLQRRHYSTSLDEQNQLIANLKERNDKEAERLLRYLELPDLTRLEGSPVKTITERVLNLPSLKNLDIIETPEIITSELVFDLFNFPKIIRPEVVAIHTMLMKPIFFDLILA
jgi:hypothetical protein